MSSLEKAAKICGQTKQAFVQTAVLAEVAEVLDRHRLKKVRFRPTANEAQHKEEIDPSTASSGIGIGEALRQRREIREEPAAAPAQSPVIVNIGSGGTAPNSDIDRLATYVTNGGERGRDTRLRTAVAVLVASATTEEERKVLAARLDEAVATKTKTSATGDEGLSVKRVARIAFDKLSDFWEGES
jgi:hypothetical protein